MPSPLPTCTHTARCSNGSIGICTTAAARARAAAATSPASAAESEVGRCRGSIPHCRGRGAPRHGCSGRRSCRTPCVHGVRRRLEHYPPTTEKKRVGSEQARWMDVRQRVSRNHTACQREPPHASVLPCPDLLFFFLTLAPFFFGAAAGPCILKQEKSGRLECAEQPNISGSKKRDKNKIEIKKSSLNPRIVRSTNNSMDLRSFHASMPSIGFRFTSHQRVTNDPDRLCRCSAWNLLFRPRTKTGAGLCLTEMHHRQS